MSASSKLGVAFLLFFGLAFGGMGGALMLKFLSAPPANPNAAAGAIFAGGFALIGLLFMVGAGYAATKLKQSDQAKAAHPNSPWLWREDWKQSRSYGQRNSRAIALWVATIVVGCITLPWIAIAQHPSSQKAQPPLVFFIVVGSFAPLIAISAITATIRRERYGKTYFEFDSVPISPGKKLTGRIALHLANGAQHGIDVRLCCLRRITTGSGDSRSTHDETLWEQEQNVPANLLGFGALGTSVPVSFDVPADAYESNNDNPSDKILWLLRASADVPGVDFKDEYELPVFRPAGAPAPSPAPSSGSIFTTTFGTAAATFANQAENEPVERPAKTSAVFSTDWNGTQIYFPPLRNPLSALELLLFTSAWTAVVYFLLHSKAPILFPIVFGGFDILLLLILFSTFFSSAKITLSSNTLTLRKSFMGMSMLTAIPFSEIAEVHPYSGLQQGSCTFYGLRLTRKDGRKLNLASGIADRQEARWLVSQIESAAGLKQDTRVELTNFYGPPPQRGVAPLPVHARKAPGWAAVLVMVVWIGFIFGRVLIPIFSHSQSSSSVRAKAASRPAIQVLPRKFVPITEADISRIASLPVQDQAEELLERSIGHDQRALEILSSHYADYKSQLKESPRMKQLLNRAQYSTDLRVRYAYSDMMLAMDGWNEDNQAVGILLDRAKNEPGSRAYDMWYLGMLGGRGVETEQVQAALYHYALHDPDANVRQAAAEGLRFLGTDEALDDLFQIFTTDASFNVRDRAGCNLSDGGDFMRKQRMRMFPKFLELAEAPDTSAQMRNWSFLAMQEITDVRLPGDAKTWHRWYDEHGTEKMAEFQALPEWQVRGDE